MCQCEFMLILMKGCCANCGRLLSARLISAKSLSAEEEEDIDVARERRRLYEGGAQDDLLKICDLTKVLCAVYVSSCRSAALTMRHFCYSFDSFMFFGSDVDWLLFLCSLSCVSCGIFHGNKSNTETCSLTFVYPWSCLALCESFALPCTYATFTSGQLEHFDFILSFHSIF